MAISVVKVPNNANNDQDFIAFSFNGKHSYDDFGIIRTIDSDRYDENLAPTLEDKTAEVPGGDGQYYFGTLHKTKTFNVNIAFENMTEKKFREMKQWLNGKELGELWFSEAPYKVWTAKVVGTPILKYIPFEINGQRIYRGEGTIQFTAYWPYAHTPDYVLRQTYNLGNGEWHTFFESIPGGSYLYVERIGGETNEIGLTFKRKGSTDIGKTLTSSAKIQLIDSQEHTDIKSSDECSLKLYLTTSADNLSDRKLIYYKNNGKDLDSYIDFSNRDEWSNASGLTSSTGTHTGENPGDIPTTFTLTYPATGVLATDATSNKTFTIGGLSITINKDDLTAGSQIIWNSKTGLVTKKVGATETLISYTGTGCGAIPVNGVTLTNQDYQLNYHYWYY